MKKVLFLIHDLGHGGAEKVLVNLVNHMDPARFDITVLALFGGGVNERFLKPHIHFRTVFRKPFPGNSHVMKLFSPERLHKWFIREHYDIEISYLEGPSARIISGCPHEDTKLFSWIHCTMKSDKDLTLGFRSSTEAKTCYNRINSMVYICRTVQESFLAVCPIENLGQILYNTNETERILTLASEPIRLSNEVFCWCGVGRLIPLKGFDRMLRIQKKLKEDGFGIHLYILGEGQQKDELEQLAAEYGISESVTFLGYQTNPYKYVANCDLFVCASHSEGFSTAATEALIVGTPVCTVEVSGMKEMLGENNDWGLVTENNEEALYQGIRQLLENPALLAHYREKAAERGKMFSRETTVKAVEEMLLETGE